MSPADGALAALGGQAPVAPASAAEFVRARRAMFGLTGANNRVPEEAQRAPLPPCRHALSENGHFRFGYDADAFAVRQHPAQRYWTGYGSPTRLHDGFAAEFLRAVTAIGELGGGRISISAGAGYVGRAVLAVARRLRLEIEQIVVEVDGVAPRVPERNLRSRRRRASFVEFASFARGFASRVGCADAWIALEAFHATTSPRLHVCDGGELKLMNHGVDPARGAVVAPADWTLVDNEKFTALDRFLIANERPGTAQVLRWSPELIAAQLDAAPNRRWLAATARASGAVTRAAWTNQAARLRLFREAFPGIELAPDARAVWRNADFVERMRLLSRELRHANPGCAQQHHTPLARLASQLGLDLGPVVAASGEVYGRVAPDGAPSPGLEATVALAEERDGDR